MQCGKDIHHLREAYFESKISVAIDLVEKIQHLCMIIQYHNQEVLRERMFKEIYEFPPADVWFKGIEIPRGCVLYPHR